VNQSYERERAVRSTAADRQDEQAIEDKTIGCLIGEAFLNSPLDPAQFGPRIADPAQRAAWRPRMHIGGLVGGGRERSDYLTGTAGCQ
jgi:hypothetical protein